MHAAAPHSNSPHHDRRWLILGVIGIAQLMVVLDVTIVNIALPSAQQDLGFSDDDRQWVITAYALAFGSLLLLGGRIADLFGRKWTFVVGLLGFAGASALGGAAQSFELLVGARALQGVFARAARARRAVAADHDVHRPRRARQGVRRLRRDRRHGRRDRPAARRRADRGRSTGAGACTCRSSFAVPAAIAGVRLLHHVPVPARPRLDIPGTLLGLVGPVRARLRPRARGDPTAGATPLTVAFLAASAVLLAAFVALQRRVAQPAAAAARGRRPQPRRLVPGDRHRRRRHLRRCSCS